MPDVDTIRVILPRTQVIRISDTEIAPGSGGATAFIALTDVPNSYSGKGGDLVRVKIDETGLEFIASVSISVDWGQIGGTLSNQTDLQSALDAKVSKASGATPTTLNEVISLLQSAGLCS